jgi:hypothetical protein
MVVVAVKSANAATVESAIVTEGTFGSLVAAVVEGAVAFACAFTGGRGRAYVGHTGVQGSDRASKSDSCVCGRDVRVCRVAV